MPYIYHFIKSLNIFILLFIQVLSLYICIRSFLQLDHIIIEFNPDWKWNGSCGLT